MGDDPTAIRAEELLAHRDFVRAIVIRVLGNDADADDVVQETLATARSCSSASTRGSRRRRSRRGRVDEDGVARIAGLLPGRYRLTALRFRGGLVREVEVRGGGETVLTLDLP